LTPRAVPRSNFRTADSPPNPSQGFAGSGRVAGVHVACLTATVQSLHHLGYDPDEKDHHDMRLLADRFDIDLPGPYRR
jgi:lincosamide nucleotidyltransferase A/C/D/E